MQIRMFKVVFEPFVLFRDFLFQNFYSGSEVMLQSDDFDEKVIENIMKQVLDHTPNLIEKSLQELDEFFFETQPEIGNIFL